MKCVIVGYGSIGKRHTEIMQQLNWNVSIVSQQDIPFKSKYTNVVAAIQNENPDYVIIANETHKHFQTLSDIANCGFSKKVLIEKPLFDCIKEIPKNNFKQAFVGYNLRFHPIIKKVFKIIKKSKVLFCEVYVGQYLPYWRPHVDYRKTYSSKRGRGGGVLLDLSHELDYLLWFFEDWSSLVAVGGQYSCLEIDSDDLYSFIIKMKKCPIVQVNLNYLDKISRREMTIITEDKTLKIDLIRNTLQINHQTLNYQITKNETYYLQHQAIISEDTSHLCSLNDSLKILEIIKCAEKSNKEMKWVYK